MDDDHVDEKKVPAHANSPSQVLGYNKLMISTMGSQDFDWIMKIDSSFETRSKNNDNIDEKEFGAVYNEQKERAKRMNIYNTEKGKKKLCESNEIEMDFLCLIIDSLSLNHSQFENKIDDEFMTNLGSSQNITETGIAQVTKDFSENLPSLNAMKATEKANVVCATERKWGDVFDSPVPPPKRANFKHHIKQTFYLFKPVVFFRILTRIFRISQTETRIVRISLI